MSELSVTDVQKALRDHAMLTGHDVTQSNRQLHFRDNVFGLVARRHLDFRGGLDSSLYTHLTQSESPLISTVNTKIEPSVATTRVDPMVPHTIQRDTQIIRHGFHIPGWTAWLHHPAVNVKTFEDQDSLSSYGREILRSPKSSFFQNMPTKAVVDPVEALKRHQSARMLGLGIIVPHESDQQPARLMTLDEFNNFDNKEAYSRLGGSWSHAHPPYSDKITVGQLTRHGKQLIQHGYEYDPITEQMNKVVEKEF